MSLSEVVVEGTLKPDGTLELHQKPDLAPGRVRVAMQPLDRPPQPLQENLLQYVLRARDELETRGAPFMNEQEVNELIQQATGGRLAELDKAPGKVLDVLKKPVDPKQPLDPKRAGDDLKKTGDDIKNDVKKLFRR